MPNLVEALTADDIIGEIRRAIRSDLGQRRVYILVEGIDDLKVYPALFVKEKVILRHNGGKAALKKNLQMLLQETNRVIGIMDADFSHLNNVNSDINSLFFTDKHDIEMTLLSFPEITSKIFSIIVPGADMSSILQKAIQDARFISYVRWFNDVFQCSIDFDDFGIAHFLIKERKTLQELIMVLNSRSKTRTRDLNMLEVETFISENNTDDYFNLCNGHDVLSFLSIYLEPHTSRQEIYNLLCAAFNPLLFSQTQLYREILEWQTVSGFSILYTN
jgi:hypothetical protein